MLDYRLCRFDPGRGVSFVAIARVGGAIGQFYRRFPIFLPGEQECGKAYKRRKSCNLVDRMTQTFAMLPPLTV